MASLTEREKALAVQIMMACNHTDTEPVARRKLDNWLATVREATGMTFEAELVAKLSAALAGAGVDDRDERVREAVEHQRQAWTKMAQAQRDVATRMEKPTQYWRGYVQSLDDLMETINGTTLEASRGE